MIRLNKLTDYAVVVMAELAVRPERMTASRLAERTSIPQPTVAKLLKQLAGRGLARAHRGRDGGYTLNGPADAITVVQIIEAIEGPLAVSACVEGDHDTCEFERQCPLNGRWDAVNSVIRGALAQVTLGQMVSTPMGLAAGLGPVAAPATTDPAAAVA